MPRQESVIFFTRSIADTDHKVNRKPVGPNTIDKFQHMVYNIHTPILIPGRPNLRDSGCSAAPEPDQELDTLFRASSVGSRSHGRGTSCGLVATCIL